MHWHHSNRRLTPVGVGITPTPLVSGELHSSPSASKLVCTIYGILFVLNRIAVVVDNMTNSTASGWISTLYHRSLLDLQRNHHRHHRRRSSLHLSIHRSHHPVHSTLVPPTIESFRSSQSPDSVNPSSSLSISRQFYSIVVV